MAKQRIYRKGTHDRRGKIESTPPIISDARVDVVLQRIEEDIGEELNVIPGRVRRYGVNNIFTRVFSYLLGWKSDGKPVKLAATIGGAMKVASVGAGLEKTEQKTGIATNVVSAAVAFSQIVSRVDAIVVDHPMYIYPSPDGVTFYGAMRCLPDVRNIFDISMHSFKVQRAGINDVSYEIVGEW